MQVLQDTYLVVDLEMTGLHPAKDVAIEIAAIKVVRGEIVETFSSLLNPWYGTCPYEGDLRPEITFLTGIQEEDLKLAPPASAVWQAFALFAENLPLVGHNIRVDYLFLQKGYRQFLQKKYEVDTVDTLRWARVLLGDVLSHHRLSALAAYFSLPIGREHRALDDARLTWLVWQKLQELKREKFADEASFVEALQRTYTKTKWKLSALKPSAGAAFQKQIWLGRRFVFSGILPGISKWQAMQYVLDLGGEVSNEVSSRTTDFVCGKLPDARISQKGRRARALEAKTGLPRIWDGASFLAEVEKHYVHS